MTETLFADRRDRIVQPVDQILPIPRLAVLGLQHVLVMYAGAVAVPLIIGRALQLPPQQVALLISADLFACGLATLVQSLGLPGVGVRLPIMMGVTFASVGPMMALIMAGAASHTPGADTLQESVVPNLPTCDGLHVGVVGRFRDAS